MKYTPLLTLAAGLCACVPQDPPASIEADILAFRIPDSMRTLTPVKVGTTFVNAFIRSGGGDTLSLAPQVEVSAGARLSPPSGEAVQFTRSEGDSTRYEAFYQVKSASGQNVKHYKVTLIAPTIQPQYRFSFDAWDEIVVNNGAAVYRTPTDRMWATGNQAVAIYLSTKKDPTTYPAVDTATAVAERAALLQTVRGAVNFGAPIAAGSLFWGHFNSGNLLADKLTFTQFGQPFYQRPKTLSGWYRYKPGTTFTDKDNREVPGRTDSCSIYAIFYETDDSDFTLDGRNIQTSDRIVARALLQSGAATLPEDTYVPFSLNFAYDRQPDFAGKLYKLAIVFTSSKGGALFEGAVGSALFVDEVVLDCD